MKQLKNILWIVSLSFLLAAGLFTLTATAQEDGGKNGKSIHLKHKLNEDMVFEQHLYRLSHNSKSTVSTEDGKPKKPGKGNRTGNYNSSGYSSRVEENIRTLTRVQKITKKRINLEVVIKSYGIKANLDDGGFEYSTARGGDQARAFGQLLRKPFQVHMTRSGKIKSFSDLNSLLNKANGKLTNDSGERYIKNNILNAKYFKNFLSIGWGKMPVNVQSKKSGWDTVVKSATLPEIGTMIVNSSQTFYSLNNDIVNFRVGWKLKHPALKSTSKGLNRFKHNHARIHRPTGLMKSYNLTVHGSTDRGVEHSSNNETNVKTHEARIKVRFQRVIRDNGKSKNDSEG